MTYLKIGAVTLLILFILGGAFYLGVLQALTTLVTASNQGFISLLPVEAKAFVLLTIFGILFGLAYSFFRQ